MIGRRNLARLALLVVGAITLTVGITGLTDPRALMAPLGIALENPAALGEGRANYGGMHTAMGLFFLAGLVVPSLQRQAVVVVVLFVGGLALGRLSSVVLDGWPGAFGAFLIIGETTAALIALAALAPQREAAAT